MKSIAIIPARGGSKRIPRKNIRNFLGKPIIAYSIEAAIKSNIFDKVIVSTDDDEIKNIALQYGAEVPFLRSRKNADDYATLTDVLIEVLSEYKYLRESFDLICCVLPTAPFIKSNDLIIAYDKIIKPDVDCVLSISRFTYPIQRALKKDEDGKISMSAPEYKNTRSQDLEPLFHDAGQYYLIKTKTIISEKTLFPAKTSGIVIDELRVQDIDTEADWKIAEIKYKLLNEI